MKKYYLVILLVCALLSAKAQINSGNPAKKFNSNSSYPYGIMPDNLPSGGEFGKSQAAAEAYNAWKSNFVEACSGKGFRVKFDQTQFTVSEGIAYGMLLSAYAGDKALFDGLWQYYNSFKNGNGVMNWKINGCNNPDQYNGATDAELDAAMALIVAADQWPSGNYKTQAQNLIRIIREKEMHPDSKQVLNGDAWGTGNDCRNPSYMSPAYFREYAKIESNQASFWNSATTTANQFLLTNRNSTTGLVSNWAGSNAQPNGCNGPNEYGFESCRNPWRMANDVLWNGPSVATTGADICAKMTNWLKGQESNLKGPLSTSAQSPANGQYKNGTFSTYALAVMGTNAANQSSLNACYNNVVGLGNNEAYFSATLRTVTLFMLTGNWWKPGSNIVSAEVNITTPDNNSTFDLGESVTISATATISSGTISKVEFFDGTTSLGSDNSSPYSISTSTLAGGTHVITAKVYDANNTVVATSAPVHVIIVGSSNVSTTGIVDMFEKSTEHTELTGGKDCSASTKSTSAGIFWWEEVNANTPFAATKTRAGDGKLIYTISQAENKYEAIGFGFGEYCNGTKTPYTVDLTNNALLKMDVSAPATNTTNLELKIQLKDINGKMLVFNKLVVKNGQVRGGGEADWKTGAYYRYEIGFSKNHVTQIGQTLDDTDEQVGPSSLKPGTSVKFEFDFKNAVTVSGSNYPANINLNNSAFDYSKVASVVIIVVNSTDNASYQPMAFTNQKVIFSGVSLGNAAAGIDICTPLAPTATAAPALCEGSTAAALKATALTGMELQWYGTNQTGGIASTTATVPSTATAGASTYYVSQKAGACESPRTAIAVNVSSGPSSSAGPSQAAVVGPTASLSGTGSAVGTWSLVSGPSGTNVTFSPSANSANVDVSGLSTVGTYTFRYTVAGTAPCTAVTSDVDVVVASITSINSVLNSMVEIYPNPATDNLVIDITKVDGNKSVKLVDMLGRVVFEAANENTLNVEMSNLTKGMYFVHIQSESGNLIKSVVKQ
jgi:endo-1,4-beta-D-glucanase Y